MQNPYLFYFMETITSSANEKVKAVKKLRLKKYRDEAGLCVAEGVNILCDLPQSVEVRAFYYTDSVKEVEKVTARFPNAEKFLVTDAVMAAMSDTDTPSGILAVITSPHEKELSSDALVLDGVSDSGNVGTIIRTAAGAGFNDVILINCADAFSGKAVRASMGGVFRVNVISKVYDDLPRLLNNYRKIAVDMSGKDVFSYSPDGKKIALFLGNEAHGLSQFSRDISDETLSLPMANGQESLNVAVAAGVTMYVINHNSNAKKH